MPCTKGSEIPKDGHAMIIGAMKCGTSSLFDYLRGHPELSPSISKEPEFFSENQGHSVPVNKYSDLFDFDSSRHKYTLEASTGYTKFPVEQNVPKKIFEYGIRPKFIYIVRNPFDRIQSHYNYMVKDSKWKLAVLDDHLVSTSDYYLQLEQYKTFFPREDILVLDFADLKDRPAKALISVYEFLGLSTDFLPRRFEVKNVTKAVSGLEIELKRLFAPLLPRVPWKIKRLTTQVLRNAVPARKREITPEEKRVIHERLCENMRRLKTVYGIDTSQWGFNNG